MASTAKPGSSSPPPARASFKAIYQKTCVVVANITVAVLVIKEAGGLLRESGRLGVAQAIAGFALGVTIEAVILVLANLVVVALPVAGLIYYARYLTEER